MRNLLILSLLFFVTLTNAQTDTSYGITCAFQQDSFFIGERVQLMLRIKYPKDQVAIVPDSGYNYAPFEYVNKKYFPTRVDSTYAYDSIIYILSGYELAHQQFLSLPVRFIINKDTLLLHTAANSMILKRLLTSDSEKDVKSDATLGATPVEFNYPYVLATWLSIFLFVYILYRIFGKIVVTRYKLFILRNAHNRFIKEFDLLATKFTLSTDLRLIEQALAIWKNYLTRLENKPINTYTTKELIELYDQEELESTLQSLDRNVYGGLVTKDTNDALQTIKRFTHRRFQLRRRFITGG